MTLVISGVVRRRTGIDVTTGNDKNNNKLGIYRPDMKSYGLHHVFAFIDQCKEWTVTSEKKFKLESGENIRLVEQKHVFTEEHYITLTSYYAETVLIHQFASLHRDTSSSSGSYEKNVSNGELYSKVLEKIWRYQETERRVNEVKPIFDKLFGEGAKYESEKTDHSLKVFVEDMVSFGDLKDAHHTMPQNEVVGGTIVGFINTVRRFKRGYYVVSVLKPFEDCDPLVMFHHINVDPQKLMHQIILMSEDYCDYLREERNSINRYDWCHHRNWGGSQSSDEADHDDEEEDDDHYYSSDDGDNSSLSDVIAFFDYYGIDDSDSDVEYPYFNHAYEKFLQTKLGKMMTCKDDENGDLSNSISVEKEALSGWQQLAKELENFEDDDFDQKDENADGKDHVEKTDKADDKKPVKYPDSNTIYFCPTGKAGSLKELLRNGETIQSEDIEELTAVGKDSKHCVALSANTRPLNSGDWIYGKLFQDASSERYFALVVNFVLGNLDSHYGGIPDHVKALYPDKRFTSISDTKLKFNVSDFEF